MGVRIESDIPGRRRGSVLTVETIVPRPLQETFAFFADARNLEALTPPWLGFHIVSDLGGGTTTPGMLIDYRLRLHGVPIRWRTRIVRFDAPHAFIDEQLRGPYLRWVHTHEFEAVDDDPGATRMRDTVRYAVPGGRLVDRHFVRPDVRRIFTWRAERLVELLG